MAHSQGNDVPSPAAGIPPAHYAKHHGVGDIHTPVAVPQRVRVDPHKSVDDMLVTGEYVRFLRLISISF
jgi:hypothetical protein